jgi:hypothetical protein
LAKHALAACGMKEGEIRRAKSPICPAAFAGKWRNMEKRLKEKSFNHKFCVCALFAAKLIMCKKQRRNGGKYD